jgi:hypothetical protein
MRRPLSGVTRLVVVPLLLLAAGIRIGMYMGRARPPVPVVAALPPPPPQADPVPREQAPAAPECDLSCSFQGNIYPSLMLSFGVAYPEYTRCLTVSLRNLPQSGSVQVRIDSDLFLQPLELAVGAQSGVVTLSPELPWNYDLLRRTSQLQPQSLVAAVQVDGRTLVQSTLLCSAHSVNEAVSRIFISSSGQWQDTSVCFAAFVNEDHPWINALLQEAIASGGIRSFTGYQNGASSALLQAQAVWDALAARGLSYVNVATDSGTSPLVSTQYVRFLDQSVHDQGANCVDASVLFASILRRIGLRPVLLFRPGHCFTAFYDAAEGGHLVAFETTLLGSAPFASAATEGAKELQATLPYLGTPQYSIVDIALCRQQGINPIPYQAAGRN